MKQAAHSRPQVVGLSLESPSGSLFELALAEYAAQRTSETATTSEPATGVRRVVSALKQLCSYVVGPDPNSGLARLTVDWYSGEGALLSRPLNPRR